MRDFLLNTKHLEILKVIYNNPNTTMLHIFRTTGITYSHISHLTNTFDSLGLITVKKSGRSLNIEITEKGKEALYYAKELDKILNGGKQNE